MAKLVVITGTNAGLEYTLSERTILGRHTENEIPLSDHRSSRQNSCISLENGMYYIEDMKSRNGTFVNSQKISKHKLSDGDQIKIGDTILQFTMEVIAEVSKASLDVSSSHPKASDATVIETKKLSADQLPADVVPPPTVSATHTSTPIQQLDNHSEIATIPALQEIILDDAAITPPSSPSEAAKPKKIEPAASSPSEAAKPKKIEPVALTPSKAAKTPKTEPAASIPGDMDERSHPIVKNKKDSFDVQEDKKQIKPVLASPTEMPSIQHKQRILSSSQYRRPLQFWKISFSEYSPQQRWLFLVISLFLILIMVLTSRWLTLWLLN